MTQNHNGHLNRIVSLKRWTGTVEPNLRIDKAHPYELVTEDRIFELCAKPKTEKLFKKHLWERFIIQGELGPDNILYVKAAHLESNDDFELEDLTKNFDFMILKDQIKQGFPIEPRFDEIAC